jgi:hypothetical protein
MKAELLIQKHLNETITDLIKWATGKTPIEIRFDSFGVEECAVTTLYDYKGEHELSLRLHPGGLYDVHIGYYDDEDEFIELVQALNAEQIALLPERLKKVMKKVADDEEGIRLSGNLLA